MAYPIPDTRHHGFGYWWAIILGIVLLAIGAVLVGGGVWLAWLGGSWYYILAGLGLLLAGGLMVTHRQSGALVYGVVWLLTLIWAIWEVGLDGWALVPRVVAPTVILVLVLLSLPAFRRPLIPMTAAALLALTIGGLPPRPASAQDAAPATPPTATPAPGVDWPVYGGGNDALRYSPLDQITPANVAGLRPVWTFRTGDLPSEAAEGKYSPENTPLMVDGMLYVCSPMNRIIAVDAATGQERWRYDPEVTEEAIPYRASAGSPTMPTRRRRPTRGAPGDPDGHARRPPDRGRRRYGRSLRRLRRRRDRRPDGGHRR